MLTTTPGPRPRLRLTPAPPAYTTASFFTGICGMERGLEPLGRFECRLHVEIREHARLVQAKHYRDVPRLPDITKVKPDDVPDVNVMVGGPPCQDVSDAGTKEGITGSRSRLWFVFAELIRAKQPQWVIIEQVEALRRRGLSAVLADLHNAGYAAEWHCIPATAVGARHLRDRIFLVAWRKDMVRGALLSGLGEQLAAVRAADVWGQEPEVARVASDVPLRTERLTGLGNSIVPQIITAVGASLLAAIDTPAPLPDLAFPIAHWHSDAWLDGNLRPCPEKWPRDGLLLDGSIYRLPELISSTFGTDQLLWPTPTVGDATGGRTTSKGKEFPTSLRAAVRGLNPKYLPLLGPNFTTPIRGATLNPSWVDWLMGYPVGWTALDDNGQIEALKPLPLIQRAAQLALPL